MSETDNNTQEQKPKTSKLAVYTMLLALLLCFLALFFALPLLASVRPVSRADILARNLVYLPLLFSLILSVIALCRIKKSNRRLSGSGFAITGIILTALLLSIWLWGQVSGDVSGRRFSCGANLSSLGRAMLIYANDPVEYPTANKWCDLLLQDNYGVSEKNFICPRLVLYWPFVGGEMFIWPSAKRGRCHYAINPNCKPNSPPDMVLAFETKASWNQFGESELLTTANHKGEGCNILFNDYHVDFVKKEQFGELKWKTTKKQ